MGSWFRPSMPTTAPSAAKSTDSSNVIGMKAGHEKNGLPLMTSGYATACTHHWKRNPDGGPREAHDEDDPRERRPPEPHRLLEAVHRERRVGVPAREACVPHVLAGVMEVGRRRELGEDPEAPPGAG